MFYDLWTNEYFIQISGSFSLPMEKLLVKNSIQKRTSAKYQLDDFPDL